MRTPTILISLFLSTLFIHYAVAAEEFPLKFEELDTDGNAVISKDEAKVRKDLKKEFKNIDKDGNGKLDLSEYQIYEGKGRFEPPEDTETPELGAAPTQ